MLESFGHPWVLLAAAIVSLPVLFPIVQFFFGDFATFKEEAGLYYDHDRASWLLGFPHTHFYFGPKLLGIIACYVLLAVAVYQLSCRVLF